MKKVKILISGAQGAGKTTMAEILLSACQQQNISCSIKDGDNRWKFEATNKKYSRSPARFEVEIKTVQSI